MSSWAVASNFALENSSIFNPANQFNHFYFLKFSHVDEHNLCFWNNIYNIFEWLQTAYPAQ